MAPSSSTVAALLEHLDVRDVTLVAHSMAGGEVIRYLNRKGGARVARIALVAAMLPFPKLMPHGRLLVFENAPHGLYLTHRARLNEALLEFVS